MTTRGWSLFRMSTSRDIQTKRVKWERVRQHKRRKLQSSEIAGVAGSVVRLHGLAMQRPKALPQGMSHDSLAGGAQVTHNRPSAMLPEVVHTTHQSARGHKSPNA